MQVVQNLRRRTFSSVSLLLVKKKFFFDRILELIILAFDFATFLNQTQLHTKMDQNILSLQDT